MLEGLLSTGLPCLVLVQTPFRNQNFHLFQQFNFQPTLQLKDTSCYCPPWLEVMNTPGSLNMHGSVLSSAVQNTNLNHSVIQDSPDGPFGTMSYLDSIETSLNQLITTVFVEQFLALPGSSGNMYKNLTACPCRPF